LRSKAKFKDFLASVKKWLDEQTTLVNLPLFRKPMLDSLFQALRNLGGLTIRPGVARSSDHWQIRSDKLKTQSRKKAHLSDKISIFLLALVLHLSHSAIGKSFKSARARNSRQQF